MIVTEGRYITPAATKLCHYVKGVQAQGFGFLAADEPAQRTKLVALTKDFAGENAELTAELNAWRATFSAFAFDEKTRTIARVG